MRNLHRTARAVRVVALVIFALFLATTGSGALRPTATTITTDFSLSVDRNSVGVVVGGQAVVAVDVSPAGSFVGPVSLAVTGAPHGTTVGIAPNPTVPGVPAIVSVLVGHTTPLGTYALTITGTSAGTEHTLAVRLVISPPTGFTMVMNPPGRTVADGESTSYQLAIDRGILTGPVKLRMSGLPTYATATVTPSLSVSGTSATVQVNVPTNVVPGTYLLTVNGSAPLSAASASSYLVVVPQTFPNFPISGTADRVLAPGAPAGAINLALTNPFSGPMSVTNLMMTAITTNKPGCDVSNYQVSQYAGPSTLALPGHSTRTLESLGVPRAQWPQIVMLNLSHNQDACKGATTTLKYSGTGKGY